MKIKTSNTILYCNKWIETVDFYKNKIQLKPLMTNTWFTEFELTASSRLSIADAARASINSSNGEGLTITIEVEDIVKVHLFLKKKGLNPPAIKNHSWGAAVIHIYDPEGNRIEFWSELK